jgi:hypothetical protein
MEGFWKKRIILLQDTDQEIGKKKIENIWYDI